jgi:transposase
MSPPEDPTHTAFLAVIQSLTATVSSLRQEAAEAREEAKVEARLVRAEGRKELARLIVMIEGLTDQLDALLGEHDTARRAALARQREEARHLAEQAAQKLAEPEEPAKGDTPDASDEASGNPSSDGTSSKDKPAGKRDAHGRAAKPAHLPRDESTLKPTTCTSCGGTKLLVGKSLVTEEYDYVRAHLRVRKTTRVICDCADCNTHIVPEQPPMPFDRAACTFSMMAWLCFAKCGLFLPIDRLVRDFADQGAPIPSPTLTRWWQRGADLLLPIAAAVRLSLLMKTHIRTDGTGLQVVFPRVKAKPKRGAERPGEVDADGYLVHRKPIRGQILIFGDDEHAVYYFTEDKTAHHTEDFFVKGYDAQGHPIRWTGTVTADAINHYDKLFASGDYIESGCNAHGLRKFRDDKDKAPLLASAAMGYIGGFYKVDAEAKERDLTGAELLAYRQANAGPIAQRFRTWLDDHLDDLLPSHPVRKAMKYYINHWGALTHFLSDPLVHLDNNWSERALRKIALLRNNSLYASGITGARRLCALFTLIGTCRELGVEPHAYLEWALTRVVPHSNNRGLWASDLTPAAYQAAQQA